MWQKRIEVNHTTSRTTIQCFDEVKLSVKSSHLILELLAYNCTAQDWKMPGSRREGEVKGQRPSVRAAAWSDPERWLLMRQILAGPETSRYLEGNLEKKKEKMDERKRTSHCYCKYLLQEMDTSKVKLATTGF